MEKTKTIVEVDAARREPLRRIWRYVGYDEPNYTYSLRGRELLGKLGGMDDAPYHIRCHFLLCNGNGQGTPKYGSTNVYAEDAQGNPAYSWDIIDRIFDSILETGCVPFVELGFTPKPLTTGPADLPYDDARRGTWGYPPRDYGKWRDLVSALAAHCVERHGLRSVSGWYWELWNEPDIPFYWHGTAEEFLRLYDYTQAGLHSVVPRAYLGGPATTSPAGPEAGRFLKEFLGHCVHGRNAATGATGTRLDFISFHTKGGGYRPDAAAPKQTPTMHTLVRHAKEGLRIASEFPELAGLEVILSECDPDGWAAGTKHDNANLDYRNTGYYASYVANSVCKLMDLGGPNRIDGMLTWAFQFEDRPYFEGLRTLSTNGIDKPVLNVFRLLGRLGPMRLALSSSRARDPLAGEGGDDPETDPDISGIAAMGGDGRVRVFLNCHHDDWDIRTETRVSLRLRGLAPAARYVVSIRTIDRKRANSHTAWVKMGESQKLRKSQREALVRSSLVAPRSGGRIESTAKGGGVVDLVMSAHSVCLVELTPAGGG